MSRKRKHQEDELEQEEGEEEGGWKRYFGTSREVRRSVAALFAFAFGVFFLLSFFAESGIVGEYANRFSGLALGWGKWVFPFLLFLITWFLLQRKSNLFGVSIAAAAVSFAALLGLLHAFFEPESMREVASEGRGGGYLGYFLASGMYTLFGFVASAIFLAVFFFAGLFVAFGVSLFPFMESMRRLQNGRKADLEKGEDEGRRADKQESEEGESEEEQGDLREDASARQGADDLEGESEDSETPQEEAVEEGSGQEEVPAGISNIRFEGEEGYSVNRGSAPRPKQEAGDEEWEGDEEGDEYDEEEFEEEETEKPKRKRKGRTSENVWEPFPLKLLERSVDKADAGDVETKKSIIVRTLAEFHIAVEPVSERVGPTVTQFRFRPAPGVRLEKIASYSSNLSLALAAHSIRVEAPIPGESLIGIEVPNKDVAKVCLRDALESDEFAAFAERESLPLVLGRDVSGDFIFSSLSSMPHLLVAGTTGSGKSVCIHAILLSLLYLYSPKDLKLILVDPKRVEMMLYQSVPHLKVPVIVDMKKVIGALRWAVDEMEKRYEILGNCGERDIVSFNERVESEGIEDEDGEEMEKMPFIVIVIEEFSDLMMSHRKDVEGVVARLTQKARAVGIHLVVSTQRPSVDVLTGLIKSNIATRIALKVATNMDSRTIIDRPGAEKLLGRGDMLFMTVGNPRPQRIQGVWVTVDEVRDVARYLKLQKGDEEEEEDTDNGEGITENQEQEGQDEIDFAAYEKDEKHDDLYDDAKALVMQAGEGSASLLQRRLGVGYNRASNLLDALEEEGVVGPKVGSKPREVLAGPVASGGEEREV